MSVFLAISYGLNYQIEGSVTRESHTCKRLQVAKCPHQSNMGRNSGRGRTGVTFDLCHVLSIGRFISVDVWSSTHTGSGLHCCGGECL